jgi:hypothetical protein
METRKCGGSSTKIPKEVKAVVDILLDPQNDEEEELKYQEKH